MHYGNTTYVVLIMVNPKCVQGSHFVAFLYGKVFTDLTRIH